MKRVEQAFSPCCAYHVASDEALERRPAVATTRPMLAGIAEIRRYFRSSDAPVYFVSATAFNLLGMDRWVRGFRFVNYYDSFDGTHPNVFVPRERSPRAFESIEEICNYLTCAQGGRRPCARPSRAGGVSHVRRGDRGSRPAAGARGGVPSAALRHRLDSKIATDRLADDAGVPSVPNVLGRAATYSELCALAASAGLGSDLVVQTPYGDSGRRRSSSPRSAIGTRRPGTWHVRS
jgi:hypothetical protein